MKALVSEDGIATLTVNGEENVLYLEDVDAARSAVIATAAAVAGDTGDVQLLELSDPAGTQAMRVRADGSVEQTSVAVVDVTYDDELPAADEVDVVDRVDVGEAGTEVPDFATATEQSSAADTAEPESDGSVQQRGREPRRRRRAVKTPLATEPVSNPFLAPPAKPAAVEHLERDPILGDSVSMNGIQDIGALAAALPEVPPARVVPVISERTLWLMGVCGGAGVSTLASLAGDDVLDGGEHNPAGGPVVLVAPTHSAGLAAAVTAARRLAAGNLDYDVLGLILVHDRPKLSRATVGAARGAGRLFPRSWVVPYVAAWREPNVHPDLSGSTRLRRTLQSITQLTATGHHGKEHS